MNRKTLISLSLCIGVLAAGGIVVTGAYLAAVRGAQTAESKDASPPPNVEYQRIELTTVEDRLTLTGTVAPWKDVTLSAEISGKIETQPIDEGDEVAAGSELARIDTQTIQARLQQARAQARLAAQEHERARRLTARGVGAERDLDNAIAALAVAEADLRSVEIQLAKSLVKAPFDGIIDRRYKEEGEFVDIGAPLVRLVQLDKVKVEVSIPERDVPFFTVGDLVRVRLDALGARPFEGRIFRIATTAEPVTRTFRAEVELDNPEGIIKPGMIARADLIRQVFPDSVLVPIFSTVLLDDQRFAAVIVDGKARLRNVKTGIVQGGFVQVTEGLSAGDLLIVKGQYDVRDGEPVAARETTG